MSFKDNLRNPLVGRWIPSDQELLRKWAESLYEKLSKTENYIKWRKYFPRAHTHDQVMFEFMKNIPKLDKICGDCGIFDSVKALLKAMGTEPDVGMLIVQMTQQTGKQILMDTPDFLFVLNALMRVSPRFVEDGSRKHYTFFFIIIIPIRGYDFP